MSDPGTQPNRNGDVYPPDLVAKLKVHRLVGGEILHQDNQYPSMGCTVTDTVCPACAAGLPTTAKVLVPNYKVFPDGRRVLDGYSLVPPEDFTPAK